MVRDDAPDTETLAAEAERLSRWLSEEPSVETPIQRRAREASLRAMAARLMKGKAA